MDAIECARCGRRLKTEKAKALGYGTVCWRKVQAAAAEAAEKQKEQPQEATA